MSQMRMAYLHRFSPAGIAYFEGEVGRYFAKVFKEKGGMTPKISKSIGWKK